MVHGSSEVTIRSFARKLPSPAEEERLGIPDDLVGRSVMRHLNYDAARMDCLPTIHDLHGESP